MLKVSIALDGNGKVNELSNNVPWIISINNDSQNKETYERKFVQYFLSLNNINQFEDLFIDSMSSDHEFKDIIVDFLPNKSIYVFCLQNQIFFIPKTLINFFDEQRDNFNESKIHFCSKDVAETFETDTHIEIKREDKNFHNEIKEFIDNKVFKCEENACSAFELIKNVLIGFFIKKGYYNIRIKRMQNHETKLIEGEICDNEFDIENFVTIFKFNSNSIITLSYNLINEELYVIKQSKEAQLQREKECLKRMKILHPYRLKYFGHLKENDGIVLEFIDGEALKDYDLKKLTFSEKISIIINIMTSIEDIHFSKIIHRDISPENIIINENKIAVIIDFNYSRIEKSDDDTEYTSNIGKEYFTSPEQKNSNTYTNKTDIYSFGKIMYFIITDKTENFSSFKNEFKHILPIYENCVSEDPSDRMNISELINRFYHKIFKNYQKELFNENKIKESLVELAKIRIIQIQNFMKIDDQEHRKAMITNIFDIFIFLSDFVCKDFDEKFNEILEIIEKLVEEFSNEVDYLTLFSIGKSFAVKNDKSKAKHYFDLVKKQNKNFFESNQFIQYFLQQQESQSMNEENHFEESQQNSSDSQISLQNQNDDDNEVNSSSDFNLDKSYMPQAQSSPEIHQSFPIPELQLQQSSSQTHFPQSQNQFQLLDSLPISVQLLPINHQTQTLITSFQSSPNQYQTSQQDIISTDMLYPAIPPIFPTFEIFDITEPEL